MSEHSSGSVSAHSLIRWSSPAAAAGLASPPDPKLAAGLNWTVLCRSPGVVLAVTKLLHSNTQIIQWAAAYAGIPQHFNLNKEGFKRQMQKEHLQVMYLRAATNQWAVIIHQLARPDVPELFVHGFFITALHVEWGAGCLCKQLWPDKQACSCNDHPAV